MHKLQPNHNNCPKYYHQDTNHPTKPYSAIQSMLRNLAHPQPSQHIPNNNKDSSHFSHTFTISHPNNHLFSQQHQTFMPTNNSHHPLLCFRTHKNLNIDFGELDKRGKNPLKKQLYGKIPWKEIMHAILKTNYGFVFVCTYLYDMFKPLIYSYCMVLEHSMLILLRVYQWKKISHQSNYTYNLTWDTSRGSDRFPHLT